MINRIAKAVLRGLGRLCAANIRIDVVTARVSDRPCITANRVPIPVRVAYRKLRIVPMIPATMAKPAATNLFNGLRIVAFRMARANGNKAVTEITPMGQYSHPVPWPKLSGNNGTGVNPKAIRKPAVIKRKTNIS